MGSVALGSFLITTLKVPRIVITYMHKKLKNFDNFVAKALLSCCNCCLWLLEKFVQYLNRNAYTVIAIEGLDFCPSARIAFTAIVTNALRVTAINSVGDFILFLGKISGAAIGGLTAALLLKVSFNESVIEFSYPSLSGQPNGSLLDNTGPNGGDRWLLDRALHSIGL